MTVRGCVWGAARLLTDADGPLDQALLDDLEELYQERTDLHPDPPRGQRRDELLAQAWRERLDRPNQLRLDDP